MLRPRSRLLLCLCALATLASAGMAQAQFGDVEGQIVLDGEIPQLEPKVKEGDATAKDAAVCAAQTIPNYTLSVDEASKGIADVFVWVRRPSKVNPELASVPQEPLVIDQKNCQFLPHTMVVRCNQQVIATSHDPIPHNIHGYNIFNPGFNFTTAANDTKGQKVPIDKANAKAEPLPIGVKCDIHPHMEAYWLVIDHPYGAITDKEGKFTIKGLPAGKNQLTIWHSTSGYLVKALDVDVKPGQSTTIDPVKVKPLVSGGKFNKLEGPK
jgi:hypothetical protein